MTPTLVGTICGGIAGFLLGCVFTTAARRRFVANLMPHRADYLDADMGWADDHDFHEVHNG